MPLKATIPKAKPCAFVGVLWVVFPDSPQRRPKQNPVLGSRCFWDLSFLWKVSDGKTWSLPVDAFLAVNDDKNQVPVAHAGADQTARLGHTARLHGSRSYGNPQIRSPTTGA